MNRFNNVQVTIFLALFVFASALLAGANTTFSSQRVERLAEIINISKINRDTLSYTKYNKLPVIIESIGDSIVHIGIDIFGTDLKETNPVIYRFIEQYLLEAISLKSESESLNKIYGDGIKIDGNLKSIPILTADDAKVSLSLSQEKGIGYKVNWSNGAKSFCMKIPSNFQLISGNNKIALENIFKHQVASHKIKRNKNTLPIFTTDTIRISENIWVVNKGYYVIKELDNSQYFTRKDRLAHRASQNTLNIDTLAVCKETVGVVVSTDSVAPITSDTIQHIQDGNKLFQDSLVLVCDSLHPIETIHNLLSNSTIENDIIVNVSIKKYGFKKEKFECPLNQLIDYCLEQGCIPYVGIDADKKSNKVTAYLTMVQPDYCYNHVFRFIFDADVWQNLSGKVSATLSAYIPTHNISTLYGEKKPK